MQLGLIADPTEEYFRLVADAGLDFIEFCVNGADTGTYLERIVPQVKSWMKKYHLGIGSIGRWNRPKKASSRLFQTCRCGSCGRL